MTPEELRQIQEMDRLAELEAAEAPAQQKVAIAEEGELPQQPSIPQQIETNQINEQAKSPYQSTKQELVEDKVKLSPLEELMQKSNDLREKSSADIKTARSEDSKKALLANLSKALGNIGAADIQRKAGVKAGLESFEPVKVKDSSKGIRADRDATIKQMQDQFKLLQAAKNEGMNPYQKASLDLATRKQDFAEKTAAAKKAKPVELSKSELAKEKDERKHVATLEKENRKTREAAQKSVKDVDKQIAMVKKAQQMLKDSTKNLISDTGPIDQYISPMSSQGQKLRQTFNEISLDKMTKMFAGMSKAIDSDAERKFFEQSQPSMGNYPDVNIAVLNDTLKNLESLKRKNKEVLGSIDKEGRRIETPQEAPMDEFVTMVAPNGQVKNVRKEQVQKYLDKGAKIKE